MSRRLVGCVVSGVLLWVVLAAVLVPAGVAAPTNGPVISEHQGFGYADGVSRPTADKPQSKLWYAHDAWWALMATSDDGTVHIFELTDAHSWRDTGTVVDRRLNSTGDVLWDGTYAYVASRVAVGPLQVSRFSFQPATRTWRASGPAAMIETGGSASATIAKDSNGRLWITYVQDRQVWVAHTMSGDQGWTAPFNPAVPDKSVSADDISAVVTLDGQIGVMWSDQTSDVFNFAVHDDGADDASWSSEVAYKGYLEVDDHIDLQTASSASGTQVLAAVKSSLDTVPGAQTSATQIAVLVRSPQGMWTQVEAGTVDDRHTRPILVVDSANRQLYMIAAVDGVGIVYKRSPLDDVAFPDGRGESMLTTGVTAIGDPTSTKAAVTQESGMVVLADAAGPGQYFHAEVGLPEPAAGRDVTPPSRPVSMIASASAGCQVRLQWAPGTDDVAVLRYELQRDGVALARTTAASYVDTSASCGTVHRYSVATVDGWGNVSALRYSDPVVTPAGARPGSGVWLAGSASATNAGGAALEVPVPPVRRGDVLLASVDASVDASAQRRLEPPAGWRLVRRDVQAGVLEKSTFVRVARASAPATARFSFEGPTTAMGSVSVYRGVDPRDPVVATSGRSNLSSDTLMVPAVDAGTGGAMIGLFTVADLADVTPTGSLVRYLAQSNVSGRDRMTAISVLSVEGGPAGSPTATVSRPAAGIGQVIMLRHGSAKSR